MYLQQLNWKKNMTCKYAYIIYIYICVCVCLLFYLGLEVICTSQIFKLPIYKRIERNA